MSYIIVHTYIIKTCLFITDETLKCEPANSQACIRTLRDSALPEFLNEVVR